MRELLFADNVELIAYSELALQQVMSCFAQSTEVISLEISLKLIEVQHLECVTGLTKWL